MKLEVWKDIENFSNYQVSNLGRVRSKERISKCCYNSIRKIKSRILKENINPKGYLTVCLFKDGKHTKLIHKLVAETFISNPNNFPVINHINGIKTDNKVENLEWCNQSHNVKEAFRLGLSKNSDKQREIVKQYCLKNKPKPIIQLDINNNFIKEWKSAIEVEKTIGISRKNISMCITGKNKTANGYKWITKEQFENRAYKID